ncbi:MAG TPA: tRNA preQ1(34) S-adenosylmethionine ribosyltransferase-isomerase QueA [Gammaproteobacteria bacterium]
MFTSDFDYVLPPELIAQHPLAERTASRLLRLAGADIREDRLFSELPGLLRSGDLLVLNDSRVFPARLYGQKTSGGSIEILIERLLDSHRAWTHIRASKSPKPGSTLLLPEQVRAEVLARKDDLYELHFHCKEPLLDYLERCGQIPLPPYIERTPEAADRERYQTVFARTAGAVAAPTAGLHFDRPLLQSLRDRGINSVYVTLHVGAGTFQPVRTENISEHRMHSEYIRVSAESCDRIRETSAAGGRIIAVGTTVVRSLETAAADGQLKPFAGETNLFITPGYRFKVIDVLLTNFHLPRSSLLMLVCAFGGYERVMQAYRYAIGARYRFFSYGDAMLLEGMHAV